MSIGNEPTDEWKAFVLHYSYLCDLIISVNYTCTFWKFNISGNFRKY